jgi:adenosylcobinamide-GDP ribazoletransferase
MSSRRLNNWFVRLLPAPLNIPPKEWLRAGFGALLGLFLSTPYVRAGGLGQALADHLPRRSGQWVLFVSCVLCLCLTGLQGLYVLAVAGVAFFFFRRMMIRRLGGTTGDTAGALLELLELAVLLSLAL